MVDGKVLIDPVLADRARKHLGGES